MYLDKLKKYSPILLRLSISFVFLWFGLNQIFDAESWLGYLPSFATSLPIAPTTLILLNGIFEVVFAALLVLGFLVRIAAVVLGLHLLGIAFMLGYNDVAIRDVGLSLAALSIALQGKDEWCLGKH